MARRRMARRDAEAITEEEEEKKRLRNEAQHAFEMEAIYGSRAGPRLDINAMQYRWRHGTVP